MVQFYDTRSVTHGTEHVAYGSTATGGTFSPATGITSFESDVKQDTEKIYADAVTHMTLTGAAETTLKTKNYQLSDTERIQAGGTKVSGGFVNSDVATYPTFSVQRVLTKQFAGGNSTKVLEVYYGCTSGAFKSSADEDDSKVKPKEFEREISVNGADFEINGQVTHVTSFTIERTQTNASVFDQYLTKILTPADFASVSNSGTSDSSEH